MTHPPSTATPRRLSRAAGDGRPVAPVRIVHLGLGNFFRAHQAWYTDQAPDAEQWGIAAFTGRSPRMADVLAAQDGLYTLITHTPDGDRFDVVSSLSAVHPASDRVAWLGYWRDPRLAIVTLTVTEAGYLRGGDGHLDMDREDVQADIGTLRTDPSADVRTTPGRIVAGMLARREADAGALTIVPCDNLPGNGAVLELVLADLVRAADPGLEEWVAENVTCATTMVDRITPATTDDHRARVLAATGRLDESPVPTEPFSEWVIEGYFPKGHPQWETVGARMVDDVAPFELRKLWLLNGSHSLLAYAGSLLGHETVAAAIDDPVLRRWVEEWWDEAARHLDLPATEIAAYRRALLDRFANPAIRHGLAQIAADGSQKVPVRILPVLRAELSQDRVPLGAARALAAWVLHLRGHGAPVTDARASEVVPLVAGTLPDAVDAVLTHLGRDVADHAGLRAAVLDAAVELERRAVDPAAPPGSRVDGGRPAAR